MLMTLVIMAPTMEQLSRRVVEWKANLLDKGLKVNAGKSKVMVGSSSGQMIVNSGTWLCGKGVQANSVYSMYKVDSQAVYVVPCR